jgi:hypothetical protein
MMGSFSIIPVQLLINKVVKRDEDVLPAVKTTEKLLCTLIPDYNIYYRKARQQLLMDVNKFKMRKRTIKSKKRAKKG